MDDMRTGTALREAGADFLQLQLQFSGLNAPDAERPRRG